MEESKAYFRAVCELDLETPHAVAVADERPELGGPQRRAVVGEAADEPGGAPRLRLVAAKGEAPTDAGEKLGRVEEGGADGRHGGWCGRMLLHDGSGLREWRHL